MQKPHRHIARGLSRRHFLKASALGAAALAGGRYLTAAEQTKPLGVALVGLGGYSTGQLAPALQLTRHCRLTGIVTGSPEKVPVWQERYGIKDGNVYSYETMPDVANNDEIDIIYIVLPTGLHAKYAIMGAEAGKHVWCEKPMAMNVEECQRIIDACEANNVRLSIGYRMLHEPNMQEVIGYAQSQPFGPIESLRAWAGYGGSAPTRGWRADPDMGGGALYDMGVYAINALRHAAAMEPVAVTRAEVTRPNRVDVTTDFTLEFPGGVMGAGRTSVVEAINEMRVECQDGWYQLRPLQPYNGVRGTRSDGQAIYTPVRNQQALQMDNDSRAIKSGDPMIAPGLDGLRDVALVQAIFESARTGSRIEMT